MIKNFSFQGNPKPTTFYLYEKIASNNSHPPSTVKAHFVHLSPFRNTSELLGGSSFNDGVCFHSSFPHPLIFRTFYCSFSFSSIFHFPSSPFIFHLLSHSALFLSSVHSPLAYLIHCSCTMNIDVGDLRFT